MASKEVDERGNYGVIRRRLWERHDFAALSYNAKSLYCYLSTCPMGGMLGVFRLHAEDVAEHLGLHAKLFPATLHALQEAGFVRVFGRWVWVVAAFGDTPGMSLNNPNHMKAARKGLEQVPPEIAVEWADLYLPKSTQPQEELDPIADGMDDAIRDAIVQPVHGGYADQVAVDGAVEGTGAADRCIEGKDWRTS